MTLELTPQNASGAPALRAGQCAASGCPMWASIKVGSEWLCECHALADITEWPAITQRLNRRIAIVRACHKAMNTDPFNRWARRAMRYMTRVGRRDLIPGEVMMAYRYKDRETGEFVERTIERDECQHPSLWAQRIRAALFCECVNRMPAARRSAMQAGTSRPLTIISQFPEVA